jgi:hypothetical protein
MARRAARQRGFAAKIDKWRAKHAGATHRPRGRAANNFEFGS